MRSTKATTAAPGTIIDYGIAHAGDLFTLAELVKHQITKGFQPCTASGVQYMPHGPDHIYTQVLVKYQAAAEKKKPISKPVKK